MIAKFLELDQEKQQRIINAALTEFARQGFSQASTNTIVKEAGISKGLLFHYFGNKRELFRFLYDYAVQNLLDNFWTKVNLEQKDILLRWRQIAVLKLELTTRHPELFSFLIAANSGAADEFSQELQETNKQHIAGFYAKFLADIDYSLFRTDIDQTKAIEAMSWTFEGFTNKLAEQVKITPLEQLDHAALMNEVDSYLQLLRQAFYRQDDLDSHQVVRRSD